MLKLDIGSGHSASKQRSGYTPLDYSDFDIRHPWPYPNNSVDALNMSHVLEHIEYRYVPFVALECFRVLKPGGKLDVYVPNGRLIGLLLVLGLSGSITVKTQGYGSQENGWQYHKNVFTSNELRMVFQRVGFRRIRVSSSDKLERQTGIKSHSSLYGRFLTSIIKPELHLSCVK